MIVSIGSDHRGIEQRKVIAESIESLGMTVDDLGSFTEDACDYPDIAKQVAEQVALGNADFGILVCGTGIGMSIAANKINGIRAALCCDTSSARLSRQHNDANVLCLAGNNFDPAAYKEIVTVWLNASFEGERHQRRVNKIQAMESNQD